MKLLDVHLGLMQRLPVRKVEGRQPPPDPTTVYSGRKSGELRDVAEQVRLIRRAQRMAAWGVDATVIAEALNLSLHTAYRYIAGDISTAAKRRLQQEA